MTFDENKIYLIQSDTTAGFVSKNYKAINALKGRNERTKCLITANSFLALKNLARVPKAHKILIRKAKKTSFIYANNLCIRVSQNSEYNAFLSNFRGGFAYSSSANFHNSSFNEKWAKQKASEVIGEHFFLAPASRIYKLGKTRIKKIR